MTDIQAFINSEQGIQILRFLVLVAALVWVLLGTRLLSGGRSRRSGRDAEDTGAEDTEDDRDR